MLNRLSNFDRGNLNANKTAISGTPAREQDWTLNQLGNWDSLTTRVSGTPTTQTRNHNGQNQITSISGATTPTYDNNGNTKTDETGKNYAYDAWNRMTYQSSQAESMQYTPGGQRASVYVCPSGTTYSYYSADWQDLEDDAPGGSGSAITTYVWGQSYIDDLVARDDGSGNRLYVQQDANHNVTALVNTTGVVERFIYDPYGVVTVLNSTWGTTTDAYSWSYRFQGGRYDPVSGLYNFRARDYSPTLGRWMQADAAYFDGANLYEAYQSGPVDGVDPLGLTTDVLLKGAARKLKARGISGATLRIHYGFNQTLEIPDPIKLGKDKINELLGFDVFESPKNGGGENKGAINNFKVPEPLDPNKILDKLVDYLDLGGITSYILKFAYPTLGCANLHIDKVSATVTVDFDYERSLRWGMYVRGFSYGWPIPGIKWVDWRKATYTMEFNAEKAVRGGGRFIELGSFKSDVAAVLDAVRDVFRDIFKQAMNAKQRARAEIAEKEKLIWLD